jgi:hypothetical protein
MVYIAWNMGDESIYWIIRNTLIHINSGGSEPILTNKAKPKNRNLY